MDWPTPRSSPWRGAATTWSNCSGRGGFRGLLLLFLLLFRLLAQLLADLLQAHAVVAVLRGVSHAGIILKFGVGACKGIACRAAPTSKYGVGGRQPPPGCRESNLPRAIAFSSSLGWWLKYLEAVLGRLLFLCFHTGPCTPGSTPPPAPR